MSSSSGAAVGTAVALISIVVVAGRYVRTSCSRPTSACAGAGSASWTGSWGSWWACGTWTGTSRAGTGPASPAVAPSAVAHCRCNLSARRERGSAATGELCRRRGCLTHTHTHARALQWQTSCCRTHTHTRLTAPCPGLPGWAGTRKVKLIWILLKQETVSGSGISKSAPSSRQITTQAPHHSVSYRPDALHVTQATASNHWTQSVAAVLSAKGRTAAATYQIALAHARYSLYFTVGWEMPPNCPFTGGCRLPPNT